MMGDSIPQAEQEERKNPYSAERPDSEMGTTATGRLDLVLAMVLFLLSLAPRMSGLDVFVTWDEPTWALRSVRFSQGLQNGNLEATYQTHHPGVTTMWLGSLGLSTYGHLLAHGSEAEEFAGYLERAKTEPEVSPPVNLLPALRFPVAFLASVCVAIAYLLARRVFGREVALLGAIFVALDPFFLAHSRVLQHDALVSMFLMLALLALVNYFVTEPKWLFLVISGVATGLACLSKVASLFFVLFGASLFVVIYLWRSTRNWHDWRQILGRGARDLAIWGAATTATVFVLWPALWADPIGVIRQVVEGSSSLAATGQRQFFLGEFVIDPGVTFYPVVLLFRTMPITLIGLVLVIPFVLFGVKRVATPLRRHQVRGAVALCLLFIVAYGAFITLSPKKFDRYLLPVFPIVDFCAAMGLLGTIRWATSWPKMQRRSWVRHISLGFIGLCLVGLLFNTAWYHPYFLSFYNPLVGGSQRARETILVGWGEGMNLAADYLNAKENAQSLTVASVRDWALRPFFRGTTVKYVEDPTPALAADYVVTYVDQVQRRGPGLNNLWDTFLEEKPEATFRQHGIDYAWVYPAPQAIVRELPELPQCPKGNFGDKLELAGCSVQPEVARVKVTVFWRMSEPLTDDYAVSVRILDQAGHQWAQLDGKPAGGLLCTSQIPVELLAYFLREERTLSLPPGMPAGDYSVDVYVYSPDSGQNLPVMGSDSTSLATGRRIGTVSLLKQKGNPEEVIPIYRVGAEMVDGIQLLGYDLASGQVQPGETVSPMLYWQATGPVRRDHAVRLLLSVEDRLVTVDQPPAGSNYPTSQWPPGDVVKGWLDLPLPPDTPSGTYGLSIVLLEPGGSGTSEPISLGEIRVEGRPRRFELPNDIQNPLQANFDNQVEWLGYDLEVQTEDMETPRVNVTLYWRALSVMPVDYKVFTQLFGPDGQMHGQKDDFPGRGTLPTTGWVEGEIITDLYEISLDPETRQGTYSLSIGFYDPNTGERLPVVDKQGRTFSDHAMIPQVKLD